MRKRKEKLPGRSVGAAILAICLGAGVLGGCGKDDAQKNVTAAGIAYLEERESKDPSTVIAVREQMYQAQLDVQRDQLIAQLSDGTIDPFSMFKDYILLGDSRAVGYWYWGCLDKSRVLADGGHTIRDLQAQIDTLTEMNPSQIYLCYGLNDTSIGYWDTAQEYVTEYIDTVQKLQQALPNATIVVSSILPAKDPAFQQSRKWYDIPEWSAALEQACEENGIIFANCDWLAEEYSDLWDPDGIHFREAFYPYWASCLATAMLTEGAA